MCSADYEYAMESGCLSVKCNVREKDGETNEDEEEDHIFPYLGTAELKEKKTLIKSVTSEFVGAIFLVMIGCGSSVGGDELETSLQVDDQSKIVRVSLCFGFILSTLSLILGPVSGCHINPSVTLSLVTARKMGMVKGAIYVVAQCLGAMAGAGILSGAVADRVRGALDMGVTKVSTNITLGQAVCIEMFITMILVLVVFATINDNTNNVTVKVPAPLALGLAVSTCHMFAMPLTGASMNPARSLGPALVLGQFENHWVYWVGPLLGGFLGAVLYQVCISTNQGGHREEKRAKKVSRIGEFFKKQRTREQYSPPYQKSPTTAIRSNYLVYSQE